MTNLILAALAGVAFGALVMYIGHCADMHRQRHLGQTLYDALTDKAELAIARIEDGYTIVKRYQHFHANAKTAAVKELGDVYNDEDAGHVAYLFREAERVIGYTIDTARKELELKP